MVDSNTTEYYQRRQLQESRLAAQALDPSIAAIHRDMALRYRSLADANVTRFPQEGAIEQIISRVR